MPGFIFKCSSGESLALDLLALLLFFVVLLLLVIVILEPSEPVHRLDHGLHLASAVLVGLVLLPELKGLVIGKVDFVHRTEHGLNKVLFANLGEAFLITELLDAPENLHHGTDVLGNKAHQRSAKLCRVGPTTTRVGILALGLDEQSKDELLYRGQETSLFHTPCLQIISLLVTAGKFGKNVAFNGSSLGGGLSGFLRGRGSCSSGLLGLLLFLSGLFFVFAFLLLNTSSSLLLGLAGKGHGSLDGRKGDVGLLLLILESRNDKLLLLNLKPSSSGTRGKHRTAVIAVAVTRSASSAISVGAAASTSPVTVASRATATLIAVSTKAARISETTSTTAATTVISTKATIVTAKATLFGRFPLTLRPDIGGNVVLISRRSSSEARILGNRRTLVHAPTAITATWRSSHPTSHTAAHHVATVTITISLGALLLLPLALHLMVGGSCGKARILLHRRWAHVARRRPAGPVKVGRGGEARVGGLRRAVKVAGRGTLGTLGVVGLGGRGEARVLHLGRRATGGRFGAVGGTPLLALTVELFLLFGQGGKALVADDGGRTVATGAASSLAIITAFRSLLLICVGIENKNTVREHPSI